MVAQLERTDKVGGATDSQIEPESHNGTVIAVSNQKGGVGKSTSAYNQAMALAARGKRVLLIDGDPQASTTFLAGLDIRDPQASMYRVYRDQSSGFDTQVDDIIVSMREAGSGLTIDLAPSHLALTSIEIELYSATSREKLLRAATINVRRDYDYVLIDCPPNLGLLNQMPLVAADAVLIPFVAEPVTLEGLARLVAAIRKISKPSIELNPSLTVLGMLTIKYRNSKDIDAELARLTAAETLQNYPELRGRLFQSVLFHHEGQYLKAQRRGRSVFGYSQSADARALQEEHLLVAEELEQRVAALRQSQRRK